MPRNVRLFACFVSASIALSLANVVRHALAVMAHHHLGLAIVVFMGWPIYGVTTTVIQVTLSAGLDLVLVWLAAWRRQRWARNLLLALCAIGVLWQSYLLVYEMLRGSVAFIHFVKTLNVQLILATLLIQVAGYKFSFSSAARRWFDRTDVVPATFE